MLSFIRENSLARGKICQFSVEGLQSCGIGLHALFAQRCFLSFFRASRSLCSAMFSFFFFFLVVVSSAPWMHAGLVSVLCVVAAAHAHIIHVSGLAWSRLEKCALCAVSVEYIGLISLDPPHPICVAHSIAAVVRAKQRPTATTDTGDVATRDTYTNQTYAIHRRCHTLPHHTTSP